MAERHGRAPEETSGDEASSRGRRPPRWLIVTLVVVVALPLIGGAVLKAMFPPERLREIAEPQLERRIARDVHLGDVRLKVFPNIAIRLSDVRIANPPQGFSEEPAIRMDALDLRLELLPLLRRQFRLSQVRLVGPRVRYEVAPDGTNNLTGILASDSAADAPAGDAPAGSSFEIDDLVVVDGIVAYLDSETRRAARAGVEGRLDVDPSENEDGPLASGGGLRLYDALLVTDGRDSTRLPEVEVNYRAVFERGGGRVAVPELVVRTAGLELTGEATSRETEAGRTVRLELRAEDFEIADLLEELPDGMVADTLQVDGRARFELLYAGELGTEPGPELQGSATYANVSLATPGRGRILDAVGGTATFSMEQLRMPDVSGRLLGRPFEARAEVTGLGDPSPVLEGHLSGEFAASQINDFRRGDPLPVEGAVSAAIDFRGPAGAPDRWNLTGPIRLSNVTWSPESVPQPVRIPTGTVQLTGAGVRADAIPLRIGGSDLAVTFSSDQLVRHFLTDESERGEVPLVQFTLVSEQLAAADLHGTQENIGYAELLTARLAGRQVGGEAPEAIARERYERPELSGYRASGTVAVNQWVNPPTSASNVSFRVDLADGLVQISKIDGTVYGGALTGTASLDLGAEAPYELEYDLALRGAGAGAVLQRWTRLGEALAGTLDFDISGAAPLDEVFLPITAALTATGQASFVEGRFEELPLLRALRSHLSFGPEQLRGFRDLGGPFAVRDGQLVVSSWTFTTGDVQAAVSGGMGFAGLLDLDIAFLVPPALLRDTPLGDAGSAVGQLLGRLDGARAAGELVPLRLAVGGTMQNPSFSVDTDALTSSLRARITEGGRQRIEQEADDLLEDAAGGLLDRLRGGRRDTAAAPVDTPRAPADTAAEADTAAADTVQQ